MNSVNFCFNLQTGTYSVNPLKDQADKKLAFESESDNGNQAGILELALRDIF
jgi:hypothetical protein